MLPISVLSIFYVTGMVAPSLETGTLFADNRITDSVQPACLLRVAPAIPGIEVRFVERNGRTRRCRLRTPSPQTYSWLKIRFTKRWA
jgi:hypothetical protein